jgi:hypothetical protein
MAWRRWALALCVGGLAGCFKPPIERPDAGDGAQGSDAGDGLDAPADARGDASEADGATEADAGDAVGGDATAADGVDGGSGGDAATGGDADANLGCAGDGDCAGLGVAPCSVGRCISGECMKVNVSGSCDDGDVCTTSDKCLGGTCQGRAYTAAEAQNWHKKLGGSGDAAIFAMASHPSGDVVAVGGFSGEFIVPGGQPVNSEGGTADAFALRVSEDGILTRITRIGSADDEMAVLVAVAEDETFDATSGGAHVVVGTNIQQKADSSFAAKLSWLFDNGQVSGTEELPGMLAGLAVNGVGEAAVALSVVAPTSLTLRDGTVLSLEGTGTRLVFAKVERNGVIWAKVATPDGDGAFWNTDVAFRGGEIDLPVLSQQPWSYDAQTYPAGSTALTLSTDGVVIASEPQGLTADERVVRWLEPSQPSSMPSAVSNWIFENDNEPLHSRYRFPTNCGVELPGIAASDGGAAWGIGMTFGGRNVIRGYYLGALQLEGLSLPAGLAAGFIGVYDDACRITGLFPNPVPMLNDPPHTLAFSFSPWLRQVRPPAAATKRKGLVAGGFVRRVTNLTSVFNDVVAVPDGNSDALLGYYHPTTLYGCNLEE